ncbi:MAG: wyosine base formation protein [Mycobacterium sp.]|jgi:uncharacterized protein (TIGR03083 family)|nr:wyosine base formation protein [Mycobacterium sp.]
MGLDYAGLLTDLHYESDRLAEHLDGLAYEQWGLATPAQGWSIQDQVSHLAFFDDAARLALTHPQEFRTLAQTLVADGMDFPDRIAAHHRILALDALLAWFVAARHDLLAGFIDENPRRRLHPPSPGLRNIVHLGVTTFGFAHTLDGLDGLDVPDEPLRVELLCPDGQSWFWGPADASNRVSGPALDFELTITQRRHWTQTALVATGPVASRWLDTAQAFAGAPTRRTAH